jgi:hypothetical protein
MAEIRALLIEDDEGTWTAQALEVDVASFGVTREDAVAALAYVIHEQLAGKELFSEWGPAPAELEPPEGTFPYELKTTVGDGTTLVFLSMDPWDPDVPPRLNGNLSRVKKDVNGRFRKYAFVGNNIDKASVLFVKSLSRALGLNETALLYDVN